MDIVDKLVKSVGGLKKKGEQFLSYALDFGEDFEIKLDIVGEEHLVMENDITDNYVETNVAYQDQISVKPILYTITGEVGELVWYRKDAVESLLYSLPSKLTSVASFLPPTTKTVNSIRNKVIKVSNYIDSADNFLNRMANLSDVDSMQQKIFNKIKEKRDSRGIVNIKTPWGDLKGYAITKCEFSQPERTEDKTIISITFKEIRLTELKPVKFDAKKYKGIENLLRQPLSEKGRTTGENIKESDKSTVLSKVLMGVTR
jgi:hypothetical protein